MATRNVFVSGFKEFHQFLKTLPAKVEGNIMRGAMRAGQNVLATAAKENLSANGHVKSGALQRSIKVRFKRKSENRYGWMRAHLTAGDKDAYYAHMVEFGTLPHYIAVRKDARPGRNTRRGEKKYGIGTINKMMNRGSLKISGRFIGGSVAHPGSRPVPFMRNALDSHSGQAIEAFADYVRKRLPREIKKAGL